MNPALSHCYVIKGPHCTFFLQGAGIGLIFSLAVCFWIGVGSILNPVTRVTLTNTITACANSITLFNNNSLDSITNLSVSLVMRGLVML